MHIYLTVFLSVFLAELGDKTQLATPALRGESAAGKLGVFLAAATALVASSALAVVVGSYIGSWTRRSTRAATASGRQPRSAKRRIADGICYYCRRAVGHRALTMDHLVPHSTRRAIDARQRRPRLQDVQHEEEVTGAGRVAGVSRFAPRSLARQTRIHSACVNL